MNRTTVAEALKMLADLQKDTAPIELSIGAVDGNGQVQHSAIVIRKAPPKVVSFVVTNFEFVTLTERGLLVTFGS